MLSTNLFETQSVAPVVPATPIVPAAPVVPVVPDVPGVPGVPVVPVLAFAPVSFLLQGIQNTRLQHLQWYQVRPHLK